MNNGERIRVGVVGVGGIAHGQRIPVTHKFYSTEQKGYDNEARS